MYSYYRMCYDFIAFGYRSDIFSLLGRLLSELPFHTIHVEYIE